MPDVRTCHQCAAELPPDAPAGVCPQCLINLGLQAEPGAKPQNADTLEYGQPFSPPAPEQLAGKFPQLEILELVGHGGMGAVYKARQKSLDRLVALKILPDKSGRDPEFAERFAREAKALAKLSHSNIVIVYDSGEVDGLYYFIMEYVDGLNLRQTIRNARLSPSEALSIVPQICEALQYAHDQGFVHRDIKPENILLDKNGRVKIADFGLAKLLGKTPAHMTLTATHQVMGTLHYMAPEQIERPAMVDHRADIYSLGVVFYELLTGELPLGRFALPSEKAGVDAGLDNVVLRALERNPDLRYQKASEVGTDVQSASANLPPEAVDGLRPRPLSVPIYIGNVYEGLARAHGVLRLEESRLQLEFEIKDDIIGAFKSQRKSVSLPLSELATIEYKPGLLTPSIHLRTDSFSALADVPNSRSGKIVLHVERRDADAAQALVARVQQHIGGDEPARDSTAQARGAATADEARDIQAELDAARKLVHGPATGLFVVACFNFSLLVLAILAIAIAVPWTTVREAAAPANVRNVAIVHPASVKVASLSVGRALTMAVEIVAQEGPEPVEVRRDLAVWALVLPVVILVALIPVSGVILLGAWKMQRLELYGLAVMASVLAMLPCHPAFLIGLPIGIWSLAVLVTPEVRKGFRRRAAHPEAARGGLPAAHAAAPQKHLPADRVHPLRADEARRRLRIPAIGLLIAGILNCLALLMILAPLLIRVAGSNEYQVGVPGMFELLLIAIPVGLGALLIFAALQLLKCRSYNMAVLGAMLGLVPCTPAWLISLPFSIWALILLNNPDVAASFQAANELHADAADLV